MRMMIVLLIAITVAAQTNYQQKNALNKLLAYIGFWLACTAQLNVTVWCESMRYAQTRAIIHFLFAFLHKILTRMSIEICFFFLTNLTDFWKSQNKNYRCVLTEAAFKRYRAFKLPNFRRHSSGIIKLLFNCLFGAFFAKNIFSVVPALLSPLSSTSMVVAGAALSHYQIRGPPTQFRLVENDLELESTHRPNTFARLINLNDIDHESFAWIFLVRFICLRFDWRRIVTAIKRIDRIRLRYLYI